jgi:hypothetical protein
MAIIRCYGPILGAEIAPIDFLHFTQDERVARRDDIMTPPPYSEHLPSLQNELRTSDGDALRPGFVPLTPFRTQRLLQPCHDPITVMSELQQKLLLVATVGDLSNTAWDEMPIGPCHISLSLLSL